MADFPTAKTNAVDNVTDVLAKHINNLENKVGIDGSADTSSIDYKVNHIEEHFSSATSVFDISGTPADTVNYGLYVDPTLTNTTIAKGMYFLPNITKVSSGGAYGIDARPSFNCTDSGTLASLYGILGIARITPDTVADVTSAYCIYCRVDNTSTQGSTLTNAYDMFLENPTATGTITNAYGLRIGTISNGSSSNYSIYTGNGLVYFGQNVYIVGNCSALSYTDRTPFYEGDAVKEIMKIKGKEGKIDHDTLPNFVKKDINKDGKEEKDAEKETGRDIGAMVSMLTVAVQQLQTSIEKLQLRIEKVEKNI